MFATPDVSMASILSKVLNMINNFKDKDDESEVWMKAFVIIDHMSPNLLDQDSSNSKYTTQDILEVIGNNLKTTSNCMVANLLIGMANQRILQPVIDITQLERVCRDAIEKIREDVTNDDKVTSGVNMFCTLFKVLHSDIFHNGKKHCQKEQGNFNLYFSWKL